MTWAGAICCLLSTLVPTTRAKAPNCNRFMLTGTNQKAWEGPPQHLTCHDIGTCVYWHSRQPSSISSFLHSLHDIISFSWRFPPLKIKTAIRIITCFFFFHKKCLITRLWCKLSVLPNFSHLVHLLFLFKPGFSNYCCFDTFDTWPPSPPPLGGRAPVTRPPAIRGWHWGEAFLLISFLKECNCTLFSNVHFDV